MHRASSTQPTADTRLTGKVRAASLHQLLSRSIDCPKEVRVKSPKQLISATVSPENQWNVSIGATRLSMSADNGIITAVPVYLNLPNIQTFHNNILAQCLDEDISLLSPPTVAPTLVSAYKNREDLFGLCHQVVTLPGVGNLNLISKTKLDQSGYKYVDSLVLCLTAVDINNGRHMQINYQLDSDNNPKGTIAIVTRGQSQNFLHLQEKTNVGESPSDSFLGTFKEGKKLSNAQQYSDPKNSPSAIIENLIDLFRNPVSGLTTDNIMQRLSIPLVLN